MFVDDAGAVANNDEAMQNMNKMIGSYNILCRAIGGRIHEEKSMFHT